MFAIAAYNWSNSDMRFVPGMFRAGLTLSYPEMG